jgi:hypothetical protein
VLTKRALGVGLAVVSALLTAGCAAGQHAATADEKPTIGGVNGDLGSIHIRGMLVEPPRGSSYDSGDDAQVKLVIVNVGSKSDLLQSISSPAFADWGAFKTTGDAAAALDPEPSATAAKPTPSKQVLIPAGARVSWGTPESTGALAVLSLADQVWPGTTVPMTLTFAQAGSITLRVPIGLSGSPNTSPIPEPSDAEG